MNWTVYVLGDVSSFYATLNSVAMIFNAKGFMTGVYLVGGFVALISGIMFVIQKSSSEQFIPAHGPVGGLFGFAMMVACCSITASVTIEDVYTGNVNKVDHVPIILAVPASVFTTTMYGMFEKVNTAFQNANGSYMAVTQNGFVTPLKLLLTLRKGVENVDPYLVASLKQYMIDCVPGSTNFNMNDFQASPDMVAYVLSHARNTGLTTSYTNLAPSGTSMACQDLAAQLDTLVSAFPSSASMKKLVNAGMKDKSPSGLPYSPDDVSAAITNLVPTLWSASQSTDQFMTNALFYNSVWGTYNCLDSVGDQNSFNVCMVSLTQQDEQFRSDAAASGSFFAKIMMPTMIFLQLLFFGFAPIVIIYSLFKGAASLMMYVKYLGFGVWTSSWLPFSAVIQMYIQNDVAQKMSEFTEKGLLPSNLKAVYYDVLATRLGIASDMLAATPLISAAMLGLTGYGMVSLANRWSGRDHNDEKIQSPDILKNGAHVDVSSRNQYKSEFEGSGNSGIGRNGAVWNSADVKSTLGQSVQSSLGSDASKRTESASAVDASLRQMNSYKNGDTWSDQKMQSLEQAHSSIRQQAMKSSDGIADSLGFTGAQKDQFKQSFDASVGISGFFGGIKTGIQNATGKEMSQDQATKVTSQFGAEISKNESDMSAWKAAVSSTFAHSSGRESATENSLSRRLSATSADTQSSFQRFQKASSAEASVSAGAKISEDTTGGNLTRSNEGMQALNSAIAGLSDGQREQFNKKFPELETRYQQQSKGMVGTRESAQLWALKAIGEDAAFANVISSMAGGIAAGPTANDAGKFEGVGAKASQVADNPAGRTAQANIGMPSTNVPGVNPNQVGSTGAPQQQALSETAAGLDPWGHYKDTSTYVDSQLPASTTHAQQQIHDAGNKVKNSDTTISPETIRDTMSTKPIVNGITGIGMAEQQWAAENPKTAMAVNVATLAIPGLGWGGAAARGVQFGRAAMAAGRAAEGLKIAEAGTEVAQAARVVNAAGHEVPALLRGQGQATRVVNAEHVGEAAETAKAATASMKTAGRELQNSAKLAAKTSVEPGFMLAADHMADNHNADNAARGAPSQFEAGTGTAPIRNQSHGPETHQPLMRTLPPAQDALAPLGGHAGNLREAPSEHAVGSGIMRATGGSASNESHAPAARPQELSLGDGMSGAGLGSLHSESHAPVAHQQEHSPGEGLMAGGHGSLRNESHTPSTHPEQTFGDGMIGATDNHISPLSGGNQQPATRVMTVAPITITQDDAEGRTPSPTSKGNSDKSDKPAARGSRNH